MAVDLHCRGIHNLHFSWAFGRAQTNKIMNSDFAAKISELIEDHTYCECIADTLAPIVYDHTIPILIEVANDIRQHGTGTLLRVAERSFLTTAAHVIAVEHELFISSLTSGHLMQLDGARIKTVGNPGLFDLAIMELDQQEIEHLAGYKFVRLLDTMTRDFGDDLYFLTGFPTEYVTGANAIKSKLQLRRFYGLTHLYHKALALPSYDPKYHIALHGKRANATPIGDSPSEPPESLRGISGAGIWKTNAIATPREQWTPSHAKLVAVQTHTYDLSGAIQGTSWLGICTMIYQRFPELRPALGLYLPLQA